MQETLPVLNGCLVIRNRRRPTEVRYASRHSVWVELAERGVGTEVDNLKLHVDGRVVDLGPGRLIDEPDIDGNVRRLVPLSRIHDFQKLFFCSGIETIESATMNLPLILGYKKTIDAEFRHFVSDLTYDLNVYKSLLDQMDSDLESEPGSVRALVQRAIIDSVGSNLSEHLDMQYGKLVDVVTDLSDKEHEHHGYYFRKQLWNIIMCAPIMARTNLKPRGYSGDSEMMRMIYQDDFEGSSTFGKVLHKHALRQPAAQAVRNRRTVVAEMIHRYIADCGVPSNEKIRILSVACGPAAEVSDILKTPADCARMHFSLLDQDQQALLETSRLVSDIENSRKTEVSADFIKESVRTMLVTRQLQERWGRFHFIYSMGLFDYLTPPVAAAVLKKLYALLIPGGELVIGNFVVDNPSRFYMEYWMDWKIILRGEKELLQLASDLRDVETEVRFDDTGIQMLLRIRKVNADE
jgi:hypothetical protein